MQSADGKKERKDDVRCEDCFIKRFAQMEGDTNLLKEVCPGCEENLNRLDKIQEARKKFLEELNRGERKE